MNTSEFKKPLTAHALNENLQKMYNVKIDFDKYTREQLENYRNLIRTKVHQVEGAANFNELLSNEVYQKDKFVLNVLNTRIKEMLGEAKVTEKATSKAQQKFMGMVYAAKKGEKPASKEVAKAARGMSKKAAKDYAATKHKGLPAHVDEVSADLVKGHLQKSWDQQDSVNDRLKAGEPVSRKELQRSIRGEKNVGLGVSKLRGTAKVPATGVEEGTKMKKKSNAKPDFLDMDKDGDKNEPMKKAVADKKSATPKKGAPAKKGMSDKQEKIFGKKKIKEAFDLRHRAYLNFIAEGLAYYIAEDEEGKAKSITSGVDMVNDFTSWMQRIGNYQTKTMIELSDNIRANFGVQEAETFKASVAPALETALNALTTAREELNNAVAVLAGEAPAPEQMGQEPGMEPGMEPGGAMPVPADTDAMNMPAGDEFAASDAAAGGPETSGRLRRESIERGNRLMKILGS